MLKLKELSKTYGLKVYTDQGEYFGEVDEVVIQDNKISGWRIRSTRESYLSKKIEGAKGVMVPHQLIKSIGDIVIISRAAMPSEAETEEAE